MRDDDGEAAALVWWRLAPDEDAAALVEEEACVVCLLGCWEEVCSEGGCWRKAAMKEERKYGR